MKKNLLILVTLILSLGQVWAADELTVTAKFTTPEAATTTYNEKDQDFTIEVKLASPEVAFNPNDYTYTINAAPSTAKKLKDANTYVIVATIKDDYATETYRGYTGTATLTIDAADFTDAKFTLDADETYSGSPITIKIASVALSSFNIGTSDYDVYIDGEKSTTVTNAGEYTITLKGKGNFDGITTEPQTFTVNQKELTESSFTLTPAIFTYTGAEQALPTVSTTEGSMVSGTDYIVAAGGDNKTVADGMKIKITLQETDKAKNYTFKSGDDLVKVLTIEKDIAAFNLSGKTIDLSTYIAAAGYPYTGDDIEIEALPTQLTVDGVALTEGTDFEYVYTDNKDASEAAKVTVTAKTGDNANAKNAATANPFKITAVDLSDLTIDIANGIYTGETLDPVVIVKLGSKALVKETDYDIELSDTNEGAYKEVGKWKVTIKAVTGNNNITGNSIDKDFEIVAPPTITYDIQLEIGEGIEVLNYTNGTYTVEENGYLFLQFRPEVAGGTILLFVDGEQVSYKVNETGYSDYIVTAKGANHKVQLMLDAYEVEFPTIEGVTFKGNDSIKLGEPYTFEFTLADDIDPTNMKVYVNDKEVDPIPLRSLSYVVKLDKVTGPLDIRIEGLSTVGIEQITTGRIYSQNGALVVETTSSQSVQVYNVTGIQQFARTINGSETIALTPGIYIVRVGNEVQKIVVH